MCWVLVASCGIWSHRFSSFGRLGYSVVCGILVPKTGIKPVSPALWGRLLTTAQPAKIYFVFAKMELFLRRMLLLLLSRFSRVLLCATSSTAAHQAPPSLGFSRQEHWSGLPFPSPVHACMLSRFSCVQLCNSMDSSPPGSSVGFSRQEYWSGLPFPSPTYCIVM